MPRPKQFDESDAVERAMRVFWEKGYEATSIEDLVQSIGINRYSLYDAFGDKRGLFLRALERYTEQVFARSLSELEQSDLGIEAIERYFAGLCHWAESSLNKRGCLLVNTAVELPTQDRKANAHLKRQYERVEAAFVRALTTAKRRGELRKGLDIVDRARALSLAVQGCLVNMKVMRGDAWVKSVARVMLADLRP